MATPAMLTQQLTMADIPEEMRKSLDLQETESAFLVKTFSGARLSRPKEEIRYPWQLLRGIWDNGTDTTEERKREREWEWEHDRRKFA